MAFWDKLPGGGDIEDRRGQAVALGGLGSLITLGVILFSFFTGNTPDSTTLQQILSQLEQLQGTGQSQDTSQFAGEDNYEVFAGKVLGSSNTLWRGIFAANNKTYTQPKLVLFRQATPSGCGLATSQVGPHYCPADQTIYLDETFFNELTQKFGAKGGDVAEAYVIAHEVGHHVQNQLGVLDKASSGDQDATIAVELQADCYAGIWAKSVAEAGVLEPNEITEAMDAAAAVGDDRIQQTIEGRVTPENWTHGSSEQRQKWFMTGYDTASPSACNTYIS